MWKANIKTWFAISIIRPAILSVIFLFLLFPARSVFADGPAVQWEKTFGGSDIDAGFSVQQTTDGGYIIAGLTYSFGTGNGDVYLIKTDSAGNLLWQKTFDGYAGYSVQQTNDGGYIVAGPLSNIVGYSHVFLIKTDSSGNLSWRKTLGGNGDDGAYSVQLTSDGGYIIAGSTDSFGAGHSDVYLIKTDSVGNKQWQKTFGGSDFDMGLWSQQTIDGGYIILGQTRSFGEGDYDIYLIKTDSVGNKQWQKTFGGSGSDYPGSVQQTADGGYIVSGSIASSGEGGYDVCLLKTDLNGNLQWQKIFGGSRDDFGGIVQLTFDGGFTIAGATKSFGAGGADAYLIKTDSFGNIQWQKTIGGSDNDYGGFIQLTSDGGYIVAGSTFSYGEGLDDVYLIKLAPDVSIGTINGVVQDSQTGVPINGAEVFVAGMSHLNAKSDATGHYQIVGLPYNTLFTLVASASGYKTSYTNNVQVTEANPFKTVDIDLTPSPWQSLKLIELNPNPNADSMVIMKGGTGHWYYQIVDDAGAAGDGNVTTNLGTTFCSNSKIRPGVVQIDVNAADVTDGQIVRITHLNNVPLDSAHQKYFVVDMSPLTQSKIWELRTEADLGISNIQVESEAGTEICLRDEQGSDSAPELTSVSRKAILGVGLSTSVEIAGYCRINEFDYGKRVGGGVSLICGKDVRDRFVYTYDTTDLSENIAKLYTMLFSPPNELSPVLEIIKRGIEAPLVAEYQDMLEAGIYLKGSGWIKGNLGIGSLASPLGLDYRFRGEFGLNAKGTGILVFRKNGTFAVAVEISCDYEQEAGYGTSGLTWNILPSSLKHFNPTESEFLYCVRFEAGFSPAGTLCDVNIAERWGNPTASGPYNITEEVWTITGPSDKLLKAIPSLGIFYLLVHSVGATETKMIDFAPSDIREELEDLFCKAQSDAGLVIRYERNLLPSQIISESKFELDIGASGLIKLSIGAGTEGRTVETRKLLIETGRVVGTSRYPTESYKEADYTPIGITLGDVYAKSLLDVGQPVIQSILDYGEQIAQAGQEFILNAGNSVLQIGADVLEAGQKIFNVFEAQFGKEMMALAADSNMPLEDKYFGIGGTYRLEPADLNLPAPATFTISYSDSEVGDKDESTFRMYRWNDSIGKWEFIGGTVDIIKNTVTASINRFGTYAIGARVEYGKFTFDAEPNEAPSDGNSIITFASEIVRNNDGTQVTDGTLFTLGVSGGTITTADVNTSLDGVQIVTNSGILQFTLKAPQVGMKVKAEAISLNGLANVTGNVAFTDANAPQAPTGVKVKIGQGKIFLSWDKNTEIDLAGYKIYFDDDQNGPPYNGVAYYSGQNSPIDVADANNHFLRGLQSAHRYYVAVTAYDVVGNESSFSREIVFYNTLPPDSDSDGMPDSWEIKYAEAANGLIPTADDGMLDNDGDGLTNFEEYISDNNPLDSDTDGDGVKDSNDICPNTGPNVIVDANGCPIGDFDLDGAVGLRDLRDFVLHWLEVDCKDPKWCEGTDFDMSTTVNLTDFAFFANQWSGEARLKGDFSHDGTIDMRDLLIFCEQWLTICSGPTWCEGCDFDKSSFVDLADFAQFAEHWLEGITP